MNEPNANTEVEKLDLSSLDVAELKRQQLLALFPEVRTEGGKIDFERLKAVLGEMVDAGRERYGMNWPGKAECMRTIQAPSMGTLLPMPDESVDWDTTENVIIEGDNLEVLKLLQKSYLGKIKMIYIDPPYNTGTDIIYPNNYTESLDTYLQYTGQADSDGRKFSPNVKTDGRFHSKWMNMMYPRLLLARNLLTPDGVLVCTIDENEHLNLGNMLREAFAEGVYEHVCVTIVHNPRGIQGTNFSYTHEYAYFVFPSGIKAIGNRKIDPSDVDWRSLRDNGGESLRTDARNCFYPVLVKDNMIVGFGDVAPDSVHPRQTEIIDGMAHVYPIDKGGVERKWRYARQSVESVQHLLRAKKTASGYEIEIGKDFGMYRTVWLDKRYDANENGTKLVNSLVPDSPFTFPKSIWSVYDTLYAVVGDDKEAVVLDFFAGSGTTGHAVMEMNRQDEGNRKYVLIQLPEPLDDHPKYRNIAEVTRERIRAAGKVIRDEMKQRLIPEGSNIDLGFRAFKLAPSNFIPWDGTAANDSDQLAKQLQLGIDHTRGDRTPQDLLFEVLLKSWGEPALSLKVAEETIEGVRVFSIADGAFLICLEEKVSLQFIRALAARKPDRVVMRESAFAGNDQLKTNAVQTFKSQGVTSFKVV